MTKFVLIIVVTIIVELIFGTFATLNDFSLSKNQTTRLRNIAATFKEGINSEKNPCEEFYDFVCSNHSYVRHDWKYPRDYLEEVFNTKAEFLTETENKYFNYLIRDINQDEKDEFAKWFKFENSIGDWPGFEENWDDSKFNLPLAIAEMSLYGYDVFFSHEFIFEDDLKTYLKIRQVYLETNIQFEYLFWELGVKNPKDVLSDALLFEETCNKAVESIKTTTYRKFKFSELKEYLPEVDWDKHIEVVYGGKLSDDYPVFLDSAERLKEILMAISKLSPKVIANYFFCKFVHKLDYVYGRPHKLFMPVERQIFMKYIYDQSKKEVLKGMYIKYLEILQEKNTIYNFDINYSSEDIAKFVNEDIFGITSETHLAKEFKEVSTKGSECMKNHHRLIPLYKKRLAEPIFSKTFSLLGALKNQIISNIVNDISRFMDEPSPVLIESIVAYLFNDVDDLLNKAFSAESAPKKCLAKQFTEDPPNRQIKIIAITEVILKVFAEWTKTHPEVVQEENKILQEYDLNSGKLLAILIGKQGCYINKQQEAVTAAFVNSEEFSQIFNCPDGSKMNVPNKCRFWRD